MSDDQIDAIAYAVSGRLYSEWSPPDPATWRREFARAVLASRGLPPLTQDMLHYAMAAMGTGSPADAERFRLFWRFASEAYATSKGGAE